MYNLWQAWAKGLARLLPKPAPMITEKQLNTIAPAITGERGQKIAAALNSICPQYGIDKPVIFYPFIANVMVECAEFKTFAENLNHAAENLIPVFGAHRITREQAIKYGRHAGQPANRQMIANTVYGGAWGLKNLGNTKEGDGWLFRGSGLIQLTGRGNITKFTSFYNNLFGTIYSPEVMAELLREDLQIAVHGACWFFATFANLIPLAIAMYRDSKTKDDNFKEMVKRINGGYNHLDKRRYYLALAEKHIK